MLIEMKRLPTRMLRLVLALGSAFCATSPALSQTRQFQFEQFPTEVYKGPIRIPKWLHKDRDGGWTGPSWKAAMAPTVTFAGEYDLDGVSCGAECRFYQLTDLRTGAEVRAISMFDAGEELPVTRDGHPYLTILFYKPDSRMLIAEYHLDFREHDKPQTCRQRYFVLEDGKLRPISKTFPFCTERDEP